MATRSIPPEWFIANRPIRTNILIVNFNPHDTICPICRQYVGRVYTYRPGAPYPPPLPLHDHCYCWYEITEEDATPAPTPVPDPDLPPQSGEAPPVVYPEPEEPEEPGYPPPESGMAP